MSTPIIINKNVVVASDARVRLQAGSIAVVNPDDSICAHGFPSEDFAHGWLYAIHHHCKD